VQPEKKRSGKCRYLASEMALACDKRDFFRTVTQGCFHLLPMELYGQGQSAREMWSAVDDLVLKWVALQIESQLPRPEACHHLKGKVVRQSLREVSHALHSEQYKSSIERT